MAPLARISIVTPSFNQAEYITRTVRSVVLQRYPNLEYILMDGGSKDGTVEALAPYRQAFSHFRSEKDHGQAAAIADGLEMSTGDIMGYLNSDDMLAPGSLEFVSWFFSNHPEVDAIYSHRIAVDEADRALWYWVLPPHSNYLMSRWDYIPQETCFWRRSLWTKAGNVDRTFRFAMDYDFFVRCMQCGGKFRRVNRFPRRVPLAQCGQIQPAVRNHRHGRNRPYLEDVWAGGNAPLAICQIIPFRCGEFRVERVRAPSHGSSGKPARYQLQL